MYRPKGRKDPEVLVQCSCGRSGAETSFSPLRDSGLNKEGTPQTYLVKGGPGRTLLLPHSAGLCCADSSLLLFVTHR